MRLIFMGTPEFAVPCLLALNDSHHEVCAVVTAPDRPAGRGLKLRESPVKQVVQELGHPILQPSDLRHQEFLSALADHGADIFVVVGFRILPREVFALPPRGSINLHASLLPKYRGAAPIQWAIANGESETGVTTFLLQEKVDTGNMLLQDRVEIRPEDTGGSLHDRLCEAGARLVLRTLEGMESGEIQPVPQTGTPTLAPKITPENSRIDWGQHNGDIHNLIRALNPYPGAYTFFGDRRMKVWRSAPCDLPEGFDGPPGQIALCEDGECRVATGEGGLRLIEVQLEGKRRMEISEFLRGCELTAGLHFGR